MLFNTLFSLLLAATGVAMAQAPLGVVPSPAGAAPSDLSMATVVHTLGPEWNSGTPLVYTTVEPVASNYGQPSQPLYTGLPLGVSPTPVGADQSLATVVETVPAEWNNGTPTLKTVVIMTQLPQTPGSVTPISQITATPAVPSLTGPSGSISRAGSSRAGSMGTAQTTAAVSTLDAPNVSATPTPTGGATLMAVNPAMPALAFFAGVLALF